MLQCNLVIHLMMYPDPKYQTVIACKIATFHDFYRFNPIRYSMLEECVGKDIASIIVTYLPKEHQDL